MLLTRRSLSTVPSKKTFSYLNHIWKVKACTFNFMCRLQFSIHRNKFIFSQASPPMRYCSEKSFLAQQMNNCVLWTCKQNTLVIFVVIIYSSRCCFYRIHCLFFSPPLFWQSCLILENICNNYLLSNTLYSNF